MHHHRRPRSLLHRLWLASIGTASLLAVFTVSPAASAAARTTFTVPGFESGPVVLGGGLLWSGQLGVSLTDPAGAHLIAPGFGLPQVLVGGGWTVAIDERRVRAGPTGGHLASIPALQQCVPPPTRSGSSMAALTRQSLYVVLAADCVGRKPKEEREPTQEGEPNEEVVLARIRLRSKRLQVLARLGTGATSLFGARLGTGVISLAAAGRRVAVTYLERTNGDSGPRLRVHVLDARSGRVLYRLSRAPIEARDGLAQRATPPRHPLKRARSVVKTQLDVGGDVVVGARLASGTWAWWGGTGARARNLPPAAAGGTLSQGHIAYATNRGGLEHIDVLNLATGKIRTEVVLRGSAHIEGVGLLGTRLAWGQQSYGYRTLDRVGLRGPCVQFGPLGDTQLVETSLSSAGPAEVVDSPPAAARPTGPPCPAPKVAIRGRAG